MSLIKNFISSIRNFIGNFIRSIPSEVIIIAALMFGIAIGIYLANHYNFPF